MDSKLATIIIISLTLALGTISAQEKADIINQPEPTDAYYTLWNINNLSGWIRNDGSSARRPGIGADGPIGITYPRGTDFMVWSDGIVWGGLVDDNDPTTPLLRVGGRDYWIGTRSGYIATPGPNPIPAGEGMRVYRVRRDYQNLTTSDPEVLLDAAELNETKVSVVTEQQAQAVLDQYALDWQEWPVSLGAPFYDNNGNGTYEPSIDEPGLANADQVLWFVTHDIVDSADIIYASPPIGLEIQTTMWGYKGENEALADMTFQRYRLINKSGLAIDSMFINRHMAFSMGNPTDNGVATDTVLNTTYAYNRKDFDIVYQQAGRVPPAFGYALLQGPLVQSPGDSAMFNFSRRAGYKNLDMTASSYWGQEPSHPNRWTEEGAQQYYGFMKGLNWWGMPWGYYPDDPPDPYNYIETDFPLTGDPISGIGDVERLPVYYWGQRSMLLTSGPFTMQPGDTQEVVYALVGGVGDDRLDSIVKMRETQRTAQLLQQNLFKTIPGSIQFTTETIYGNAQFNEVRFQAVNPDAVNMELYLKSRNGFPITTITLFDDGLHHDGAAGDGIWGNNWFTTPSPNAVIADLEVDYQQGDTFLWEEIDQSVTTSGPVMASAIKIGSDNTNQDRIVNPGENIRFTIDVENAGNFNYQNLWINSIKPLQTSLVSDLKTVNKRPVFDLPAGSITTWNYNPTQWYASLSVDPAFPPGDSMQLVIELKSENGNIWTHTVSIPVKALSNDALNFPMTKVNGNTEGIMEYRIFDPTAIAGDSYRLTFNEFNADNDPLYILENLVTGDTLAESIHFPDQNGHSSNLQDGFKVFPGSASIQDSVGDWEWNNGIRWLKGINLFGRSFMGGTDLGNRFFGTSLNEGEFSDVRIVFDSTITTNANVFHWNFGYNHAGLGTFYGAAYDIEDPSNPRRLNIIFVEESATADHIWNPDASYDGKKEYLMIMDSDYDEVTGGGYIEQGDLYGNAPKIWFIYCRLETGMAFLQNPGELELYVYNGIELGLTYEFTPEYPTGIDDGLNKPLTFELAQNFPNPFNPETTIKFQLPFAQKTTLQIFNVLGQKVATLVDDELSAGSYSLRWQGINDTGSRVSSGVYFYRVESGNFVKTRKMLLVR